METKHTPGPWTVDEVAGCVEVINEETEFTVARLGFAKAGRLMMEANAHLIAAAPELLAIAEAFEVTGPDADGLVWLKFRGCNGKLGAVNVGSQYSILGVAVLSLEKQRRTAVAKATGGAA